jgi:hypothetical protein
MRTKTKFVLTDPEPGTTRLRRVFAWLPKVIDGDKVWLEYYEQLEAFIATDYKVIIDGEGKNIRVSKWVSLSNRVIN